MKQNHDIYISKVILDHGNKLVSSHLTQLTDKEFYKSLNVIKSILENFESHCSPYSHFDKARMKSFQKTLLENILFEASKPISLKSDGINLCQETYTPFIYVKRKDLSKRTLDSFKWDFSWMTYPLIKSYMKKEIGTKYRDDLDRILNRIQIKNPAYFRLLGFKKVDCIDIKEIEQKFNRLKKEHNITEKDYYQIDDKDHDEYMKDIERSCYLPSKQ